VTARHGLKEKFLPHKQSFSRQQESTLLANDSSKLRPQRVRVSVSQRHVPTVLRPSRPCVLAGVLVWIAATTQIGVVAGQREGQDPRGRIRSEVSLVGTLASVLDKDGRPALDLAQDQFEIYDEGVKQKIEIFEPETQQPLDLTLMIDSSLSEIKDLEFETEAAARFIQRLVRPGDRMAIYEFADNVTQIAAFTSNVPTLQAALKHIVPGDGTALYDAVYLGAQALERNPSGRRRVIVLVTDAGETTSRADFETARRAALRADALLYTIVVRVVKNEGGRNTAGEHALETIADSTGGATYFPNSAGELGEMFDRIDRELRTQYRLGYYPNPRPPDGTYRALEVRVKCECKVRSRKAYYSGGHLD
jgi:Ca-activated chloride channel family protein